MFSVLTAGRVKDKEKDMLVARMEASSASNSRSVVTVDVGTTPRRIAFGAPGRPMVTEMVMVTEMLRIGMLDTRRMGALVMCRL